MRRQKRQPAAFCFIVLTGSRPDIQLSPPELPRVNGIAGTNRSVSHLFPASGRTDQKDRVGVSRTASDALPKGGNAKQTYIEHILL